MKIIEKFLTWLQGGVECSYPGLTGKKAFGTPGKVELAPLLRDPGQKVSLQDLFHGLKVINTPRIVLNDLLLKLFFSIQGGGASPRPLKLRGRIISHINPDLDSLACIFGWILAQNPIVDKDWFKGGNFWIKISPYILLIGANEAYTPAPNEEVWDHSSGVKGNGKECAFAHMVRVKGLSVPKELVEEINSGDVEGRVKNPLYSLEQVLKFIGPEQEQILFLGGIQKKWKLEQIALERWDQIPQIKTRSGYTFLILSNTGMNSAFSELGRQKGITGCIFQDGYSMGVVRYSGRKEPHLSVLGPHLPFWFCHPDGFLCSWATNKAPKGEYPPQKLEEVIELVKTL